MVNIESAGITNVGKKRAGNEDALFLEDDLGVYIVADGLGGHNSGEVASKMVVDIMQEHLNGRKKGDRAKKWNDSQKGLSQEASWLLSGIYLANEKIYEQSNRDESCRGMGSTVSAVFVSDQRLIAANVGDSPIYLVHAGNIERLSVPHTVKEELNVLNNRATGDGEEFGHILTRAVGTEKSVRADVCEIQCRKGDTVVIASDGLSDMVSPLEIRDVILMHRPNESCQTLVELANERGGDDNITVIVLKIVSVKRERGSMRWLGSWFSKGFHRIVKTS